MADIARLRHLKKILEATKAKHQQKFMWSRWFGRMPGWKPMPVKATPDVDYTDILNPVVRKSSHFCKTTGCILGLAAMDPYFNRQGLYVHIPDRGDGLAADPNHWEIRIRDVDHIDRIDTLRVLGVDADAGSRFFDLTRVETVFLFYGGHEQYGGIDEALACVQWLIEGRDLFDEHGNMISPRQARQLLDDSGTGDR